MPIRAGDRAPDFSLKSAAGGKPVGLAQYRGDKNVVLLFFPLAWTSVCTSEMCAIRDGYAGYGELDAEVLGISVDSPFALAAWAKEEGFAFPLLSDFNRQAARSYDVLMDDLMGLQGVARRAAFVVDREGIVRYAEVCPTPAELPDFGKIQEALRAAG
ncbi:MAG TPA: peroxiredoxin [Thermoanaerobaculia bacterium]|jgi:peroxiredoxin